MPPATDGTAEPDRVPLDSTPPTFVCRHCGHAMLIVFPVGWTTVQTS
jgi:hypothetical protein